jgi:hypothetical protein
VCYIISNTFQFRKSGVNKMGLPSQLDGAPKGLSMRDPKVCPHCHNAIENYKKIHRDGKDILICPRCKKEVMAG